MTPLDPYILALIGLFIIGFTILALIANRDRFPPNDFPDDDLDEPGWTTIEKLNKQE